LTPERTTDWCRATEAWGRRQHPSHLSSEERTRALESHRKDSSSLQLCVGISTPTSTNAWSM